MSKATLWITGIFVTIAAIIGVYTAVSNSADGNPWKMIPEKPAIILQMDNPADIYTQLSTKNDIWQSLLKTTDFNHIQQQINQLDSLLKDEPDYKRLLWNSPLLVACYADTGTQNTQCIFISNIKTSVNQARLKKLLALKLGTNYAVLEIKNKADALKIIDGQHQHNMFIAFIDGLFVASSTVELLERALDEYNNKHFSETDAFKKLQQTAGKNVDARLFVHYESLAELLGTYAQPKQLEATEWLKHFGGWAEADLMLKSNEVILTGYSQLSSSTDFLSLIANERPVKTSLFNVLPFNTNQLLWIGQSDFTSYLNTRNHEAIDKRFGIHIASFSALIQDEIAMASNAQTLHSYGAQTWVFVGLNNMEQGVTYLNQLAQLSGGSFSEQHNGYQIKQIKYPDFTSNLLGKAFATITENYYTRMGDYVVFANSPTSIKQLIRFYETGKTLDLNENFKRFSDNISGSSNLLLFIKPRDLTDISEKFVNLATSRKLKQSEDVLKNIQGIAFLYSAGNPLIYTSFYLEHSKAYQEENLSLWKVSLDDEIIGKPALVEDHDNNNYNVLVFDAKSNMYLISTDGRILWKKRIDALPISDIHQVDYFSNGKIQYLFNTSDFFYLIDKNGDHVANYPLKINPSATNGLSLFDYTHHNNYRLLLAQSDKRIYNYTIEGKTVNGWVKPHTRNIVTIPVTRLVANNKDYIIITDIDNGVSIVDRKGQTRIKLTKDPKKSVHADYYINKTNSKGILITTNTEGKLMYISATGAIKYTDFGTFSPQHFFLYDDFDSDGSYDFIYVDGRKLQVFDRFKKILFQYDFETDISIRPEFIQLGKREKVLGIVADKQKSIYLFDNKGNTVISKGLVGETPFTVGSMQNDNEINLITAAGNVLYNYRIK